MTAFTFHIRAPVRLTTEPPLHTMVITPCAGGTPIVVFPPHHTSRAPLMVDHPIQIHITLSLVLHNNRPCSLPYLHLTSIVFQPSPSQQGKDFARQSLPNPSPFGRATPSLKSTKPKVRSSFPTKEGKEIRIEME